MATNTGMEGPSTPPSTHKEHFFIRHITSKDSDVEIMSNSDSKSRVSQVFSRHHIPESATSCHSEPGSPRLGDSGPHQSSGGIPIRSRQVSENEVAVVGAQFHKDGSSEGTLDDDRSTRRRLSLEFEPGLDLGSDKDKPSSASWTRSEGTECSDNPSDGDDDVDLEAVASDALGGWFGISLHRLTRPIRILDVFSRAKTECGDILQDEGLYSVNSCEESEDDSESTDSDEEHDTVDDGDDSRGSSSQAPTQRPEEGNTRTKASGSKGKKRAQSVESIGDAGSAGQPVIGTADRSKKPRKVKLYGCPYRNRNPLWFTVGEGYIDCATKGFADIPLVKRHLRTHHYKGLRYIHCPRCLIKLQSGDDLMAHVAICTSPPRPPLTVNAADPEDGFGKDKDEILASKKHSERRTTWESVCRLLFGNTEPVPDPDFRVLQDEHEAAARYAAQRPALERTIRDCLADRFGQEADGETDVVNKLTHIFNNFQRLLLNDSKCGPWSGDSVAQISPGASSPQQHESPGDGYVVVGEDVARGEGGPEPGTGSPPDSPLIFLNLPEGDAGYGEAVGRQPRIPRAHPWWQRGRSTHTASQPHAGPSSMGFDPLGYVDPQLLSLQAPAPTSTAFAPDALAAGIYQGLQPGMDLASASSSAAATPRNILPTGVGMDLLLTTDWRQDNGAWPDVRDNGEPR